MNLDWVGLIVVGIGPGVLILWGLVWLFTGKGPKPASRDALLPRLAKCRDELELSGDPASELEARPGDHPIRIALEDPEKSGLPNLVVAAPHSHTGLNRRLPLTIDKIRPIVFRKETSEDKLGKLLLVNRELQTCDEPFDDDVYIETTTPGDVALESLSDRRVRQPVQRLLEDGWTRVAIYGERDLVRVEQEPTQEIWVRPERVERAIEQVAKLAESLVPITSHSTERPRPSHRRRVLTGAIGLGWLLGLALTIAGIRTWPPLTLTPFYVCAAAAVALFVLSVPVLGLLVRGHSDSLQTLNKLLVWQFVGVLPLCVGVGISANGLFDDGPRSRHTEHVVSIERPSVSSRFGGAYAEVESWLEGSETLYVPITNDVESDLSTGRDATVTANAGALGWPWCEKVEVDR